MWAAPLPPELTPGGVLFQYEDPLAERIHIAGTFNDFNDRSLPMEREGRNFVIVLPLAEGEYRYKYVIDGQWMSGDDLKVNIIRRDGRLHIYPRQPYLRFPFSSKISMDGYYLFYAQLTDDVDGPGGKIRAQTPRNDLDLNFDIHPIDTGVLKAWAQLNVNTQNNDDKVNMDEAYLELTLGNFTFRPFETHWNVTFDDPFRALDEDVTHFDDGIYLSDEARPFHFQYGRYARGFGGDFSAGAWAGQFFFSNRVRLDQAALDNDLWGMRVKRAGRRITWGMTLTQSRMPNGINADNTGDQDVGSEHPTLDRGLTTVQFPEGSGSFARADFLTQVSPGGKNGVYQAGLDASIRFGNWTLMTEIMKRHSDAAALAYSSGDKKEIYGRAYESGTDSAAGAERVFGEDYDGLSLFLGLIYRARAWANEFHVRFHDYRATGFLFTTATDSSVGRITPDWVELHHRLQLNRRFNEVWGLDFLTRVVDRSSLPKGNIFYKERLDGYSYLFAEVPWARRTIEERVKFKRRFGSRVWFHTDINWMSIDRFGKDYGRADIETMEGLPRIQWSLGDKWLMDLGARYKSLDFGTINGEAIEASFTKPFIGFKYAWSKLMTLRFWYGLDPYVDEDKKLGLEWRLQDLFRPAAETVVDRGQNSGSGAALANIVTETERRFDRELIFALQAELRF